MRFLLPCRYETKLGGVSQVLQTPLDHSFGETPTHCYLVMERMRYSVQDLINFHHGRVPPGVVAGIGEHVLQGLYQVHHRGYVHLDIKPDNLLVDSNGKVRLTDWCVASRPYSLSLPHVLYFTFAGVQGLRQGVPVDAWAMGGPVAVRHALIPKHVDGSGCTCVGAV